MSKESLPTTASFRPEVIDEYVNGKIRKGNPITIFSPILGLILAGGGFALEGLMETWMFLVGGGGLTLGMGSFILDSTVRKESIRSGYLFEVNKMMEKEAEQTKAWIKNGFDTSEFTQGTELVVRLENQMSALEDILDDKFEVGTSTHQHFHGVAEALLIQTLNHLKDAVSQLKANSAMDVSRAKKMLSQSEGSEREAHQRKLKLYDDAQKRLSDLMSSCEIAVTGLTELTQKVAGIQSGNMDDFESFLGEVQTLSDRANLYKDERSLS